MSRDVDGTELKVGDRVMVEFEVTKVADEDHGFINLRSVLSRKDNDVQEGFTCCPTICRLTEAGEDEVETEAPPEVAPE